MAEYLTSRAPACVRRTRLTRALALGAALSACASAAPSAQTPGAPVEGVGAEREPAQRTERGEVDRIAVEAPSAGQRVHSPLQVRGRARGSWYFEGDFPVRLLDGEGRELAVAPAMAQGEWMTNDYVPFAVELQFAPPTTAEGVLVLERHNASGLAEHADALRIAVRFADAAAEPAPKAEPSGSLRGAQ